jgi:hypothetical protein
MSRTQDNVVDLHRVGRVLWHLWWRSERKTQILSKRLYNFCLNNQPYALIIPILFCYTTLHVSGIFSANQHKFSTVHLFCYKTLHVSGIFSASQQEFSTVHSALVSFMQVFDDRFLAESGWNSVGFYYENYKEVPGSKAGWACGWTSTPSSAGVELGWM